ncbi:hypothetical protein DIURU_004977 [Diutina rugosa]|uniref:Origin recognition complex subunit 3 winged helix C-terminal domain-containing protein n=1 Tax=Diutina rugosa TaxID=5481 RepID=A0A642UFU2_DIURU|nr:uncharacterized protein DIURU_004977 [Diutina rugosa]KAA8898122.1 hypothetical protein DIURU_004977 [Diutina rugosa]
MDDRHHHQRTHYLVSPARNAAFYEDGPITRNPMRRLFGGAEPEANVNQRYKMFDSEWTNQSRKLEQILGEMNTELFRMLHDFVNRDYDRRSPVAMLKLSTNTANNARILDQFRSGLDSRCKSAVITSQHFENVKMAVRELMRQVMDESHTQLDDNDDINEARGDSNITKGRLNFDIDILPDWVEAKQPHRLVVIVQDTNNVNMNTLNELVALCASLGLPLRWVWGVSSNNMGNWLNSNLTIPVRRLIEPYLFEGPSNSNLGFRILEELFLRDPKLLLDSKLSTILLKRFEKANNSVDSLVAEIKMCYMIHFYQSPLSVLQEWNVHDPIYIDGLRKLPSFKKYIEVTGDVEGLTNDDYVYELFTKAKTDFGNYKRQVLLAVDKITSIARGLIKIPKFEIYHALIDGRFITSSIARRLVQVVDSAGFEKSNELEEIFKHSFRPIDDYVFYEIFTLDGGWIRQHTELIENYNNLTLHLIRPPLRKSLEDALNDSSLYLGEAQRPLLVQLFNIYREAPTNINIYDFYTTFRSLLNRQDFVDVVDDNEWNRMTYAWFIQNCSTLVSMGFLKEKPKGDFLDKSLWRGA